MTREPSIRGYCLVFCYDVHTMLDRFIRNSELVEYMQYTDFDQIKEIGFGGYGTVYTAKYKKYLELRGMDETGISMDETGMDKTVVLKQFLSFDETPELFISEVNNNWSYYLNCYLI